MSQSTRSQAGFTLLEMLVALSIFALLSVMSYGGLNSVLKQRVVTEEEAERLAELQKIYLLMQRDIEQIVPRSIRDEYGAVLAPVVGNEVLQFTRAGWNNPLGRPRSNLQRVGYAWVDERLVRYIWLVLDRAQDTQPLDTPLSDNIAGMSIRYLAPSGEWLTQWPDPSTLASGAPPPDDLPLALEVTLDHKHYGEIVWLFQLPR